MLNLLVNDPFTPMQLTAPSFKFHTGATPFVVAILFQAIINSRFNSCPFFW